MRSLPIVVRASLVAGALAVNACSSSGRILHPSPPASGAHTTASISWEKDPPVTPPPAHGRFDYQIGGPYSPERAVTIVERDRGVAPAAGRYNICYVNAFQTQPEEAAFWSKHADLLLHIGGRVVTDPDWPGEHVLDTSTAAKRASIAAIVDGWFASCASRGYRAVEPDNLDSWTRSRDRLTKSDNAALATLLTRAAHRHGLAVAQKNTPELAAQHTSIGFDFAVAEECAVYDECGIYTKAYGTHVIEIEYTDNGTAAFAKSCAARGKQISVILRDRDVVPRGAKGYFFASC